MDRIHSTTNQSPATFSSCASKMYNINILLLMIALLFVDKVVSYPSPADDDRFPSDREFQAAGAHQLASWIVSQLRKTDMPQVPPELPPIIPYRLPIAGKRNSELTSSIMAIPRTMIENGRR